MGRPRWHGESSVQVWPHDAQSGAALQFGLCGYFEVLRGRKKRPQQRNFRETMKGFILVFRNFRVGEVHEKFVTFHCEVLEK